MSLINPTRAREFYESTVAQHSLNTAMELDEREMERFQTGRKFPIQRGEVRDSVPEEGSIEGETTGQHWTVRPIIARRFAEPAVPGKTTVMWHGMLDDRAEQEEPNSHYGQPQEREITLRNKAPVRVTGMSYYTAKEGEEYTPTDPDKWTHVDFKTHPYLGAAGFGSSRGSLSENPDWKASREKIGGTRDVWTQLAGGDTTEGIRHSKILSPSQFASLKSLNPNYSYPANPRKTQRWENRVFDAKSLYDGEEDFEGMPYHHPDGRILTPEGDERESHIVRWANERLGR